MIKEILSRKIAYIVSSRSTRVGVIQHNPLEGSNKWVLKAHLNNAIISTHPSLVEAKKALRGMHKYSSLIPRVKEKEIIVWLRQQTNVDKQQLLEFLRDKFNLNDSDSERLYLEAYPEVLTVNENEVLNTIDQELQERDLSLPLPLLDTIIEIHADGVSPNELCAFQEVPEDISFILYSIIEDMLKSRKLI